MPRDSRIAIDLADPNLPRLIWRAGVPAMAGLSLNAAHQVVDAGFVGQIGAGPLAVLALMAPLAGLVAALGIGLGIGAASAVARAMGEGRLNEARQVSGVCFLAAFVLALVLAAMLWAGHEIILRALDCPAEILPLAQGYLPVQIACVALAIIQILCDLLAVGRGEVRFSLRTLALCFGLNIAFDPLFIFDFGLGLGLNGAAWATLSAQIVTLAVWAVWFSRPVRRPAWGRMTQLWPVLRVGLPEAASVAVTTLGFVAVLRMAATLGGVDAVAGLGVALRLLLLIILPLEGFAIGVQPVLAHAHGAADPERLARAQMLLVRLALAAGTVCAVALWAVAGPVTRAMSDAPGVQHMSATALRWMVLAVPAIAVRLVAQIGLQAAIRPIWAMVLGLAPMGWLLWPSLIVLVPRGGTTALPVAITLSAWIAAILAALLLVQGRRLTTPIGALR